MKIVSIVGTRPQFIKYNMFAKATKNHEDVLIHSGQHYDVKLNDVFFEELCMNTPDFTLNVAEKTNARTTATIILRLEKVLRSINPDVVVVYGDCNTTLAGAYAAAVLKIPVAHAEAGLRCYNMQMIEELNRVLTDRMSTFLFAPTDVSRDNLHDEGFLENVFLVGDLMYESFNYYKNSITDKSILDKHGLQPGGYNLATVHRAENVDSISTFDKIRHALQHSNKPVVFPVHPRTQKHIDVLGRHGNILYIEPVSYKNMITLEKYSDKIITDSGGVQCEAYFAQKPCIVLREDTEYPEIHKGWIKLVGSDVGKIIDALHTFYPPSTYLCPFSSFNTSQEMVKHLEIAL